MSDAPLAAPTNSKNPDPRVIVTSSQQYAKELNFAGLIVAEVCTSAFGPCDSIVPTLQSLMVEIPDAKANVKWLTINVGKLEQAHNNAAVEEEKKKKDQEMVQRIKASNADHSEHKYDGKENSTSNSSSQVNSFHLPLLDKYSGYDHPRPIWTFIKNHRVIGDLRSVNPPRLRKLVTKYADPQFRDQEPSYDTLPIIPAIPIGINVLSPDQQTPRVEAVAPVQAVAPVDSLPTDAAAEQPKTESSPPVDGTAQEAASETATEQPAAVVVEKETAAVAIPKPDTTPSPVAETAVAGVSDAPAPAQSPAESKSAVPIEAPAEAEAAVPATEAAESAEAESAAPATEPLALVEEQAKAAASTEDTATKHA